MPLAQIIDARCCCRGLGSDGTPQAKSETFLFPAGIRSSVAGPHRIPAGCGQIQPDPARSPRFRRDSGQIRPDGMNYSLNPTGSGQSPAGFQPDPAGIRPDPAGTRPDLARSGWIRPRPAGIRPDAAKIGRVPAGYKKRLTFSPGSTVAFAWVLQSLFFANAFCIFNCLSGDSS